MKLWKFEAECGRMGTLSGMFFASDYDIERYLIGRDVYFGEVLGKHSDIHIVITREQLKEIKIDEITVRTLYEAVDGKDTLCGYNPFDYLPDEEEDDFGDE